MLLRIFELHILVLGGDLPVHVVHRVQLLLEEQTELHFLLVLQEVLLVLLEHLVSPLLLLTLGARQFIIELAELPGFGLLPGLTHLQLFDLCLVPVLQLVNFIMMVLLQLTCYHLVIGLACILE